MAILLRSLAVLGLLFSSSVSSVPLQAQNNTISTSHESGGEEHIVIVDKNAPIPPSIAEILRRLDLNESHPDVRHVFNNSAFQGFAASMKSHCLDLLSNMTEVSHISKSTTVSRGSTYTTRPNSPWGLQRISTTSFLTGTSESSLDYTYTYQQASNNNAQEHTLGTGADIYILDTGLYTSHNIFTPSRAQMLWSFNNNLSDLDGHGTHVAGTAAGSILGVASNAKLYGVKTLSEEGGGWSSNVVAGIDFVVRRHDEKISNSSGKDDFLGSIISMSLASSDPVPAINTAVSAAIEAGIHVIVAAGNAAKDACTSSPASAGGSQGGALTVGAIDIHSQPATFSNYGTCVDLYAPGVDIISSWIGAENMVNTLSGTSMAAPHVTGIVAVAMGMNSSLARDPAAMKRWVLEEAVKVGEVLVANNGVRSREEVKLASRQAEEMREVNWEFSKVRVGVAGQ